jgi:hypothetical protein
LRCLALRLRLALPHPLLAPSRLLGCARGLLFGEHLALGIEPFLCLAHLVVARAGTDLDRGDLGPP